MLLGKSFSMSLISVLIWQIDSSYRQKESADLEILVQGDRREREGREEEEMAEKERKHSFKANWKEKKVLKSGGAVKRTSHCDTDKSPFGNWDGIVAHSRLFYWSTKRAMLELSSVHGIPPSD